MIQRRLARVGIVPDRDATDIDSLIAEAMWNRRILLRCGGDHGRCRKLIAVVNGKHWLPNKEWYVVLLPRRCNHRYALSTYDRARLTDEINQTKAMNVEERTLMVHPIPGEPRHDFYPEGQPSVAQLLKVPLPAIPRRSVS